MRKADGGATSATLLEQVRNWEDQPAWSAFYQRYNPMLLGWSLRSGLDEETAKELCQRIWIELAERMPAFRYDPGRRFRGWLRTLWRCRALDLLEERRREGNILRLIDDCDADDDGGRRRPAIDRPHEVDGEHESGPWRLLLLREAERAQADVRARVDPRTWEVFWHVAVYDWSVRETASAMGMSYAAAFAAHQRVDRRLREAGARRLAELVDTDR